MNLTTKYTKHTYNKAAMGEKGIKNTKVKFFTTFVDDFVFR